MDDRQLQELVEEVSQLSFGKPFRHKAAFNNRLRTTGGRYLLKSHNIELNVKYYQEHGISDLIDVIKHELCHYHLHIEGKGYKHRDRDFKQLLTLVNAPRYCKPIQATTKNKKYEYKYECIKCKKQYMRKKRMDTNKYVCGQCRGRIRLLDLK
ncbi:SprT family protein [Bacillus sp. SM2101]|uniref:SprT family protein n=1 Tax=Bacillus sp. SM2101 TaxID=2805366 RepID=UPI001BDE1EA6|nr:SprT family protein [Bacillus sp. SM2101]